MSKDSPDREQQYLKIIMLIDEATKVAKKIETITEDDSDDPVVSRKLSEQALRYTAYYQMLCERVGQLVIKYGTVTLNKNVEDEEEDEK